MNNFSTLFLVMLALSVAVEVWLALRQIRHVQKHRATVPDAFADSIALADHQKAADYTITRTRFGFNGLALSTALLLFLTFGGGFQWFDTQLADFGLGLIWHGVLVLVVVSMVSSLLDLPLAAYKTFVIEDHFGFNRTSVKQFFIDLIMGAALGMVIGIPLLWVALSLMSAAGEYWWAWLWLFWTGFMLFMLWAYPTVIAPLFNKFLPLEDEDLKQRIESLLTRCGFQSKGVFVMDGSKRSGHGNAYFTGIGNNKRIVFFDTLLDSLDGPEIEAVLAHELGHFRRHHVRKRMIMSFVLSLAGLALLGWLVKSDWFYAGLGVETVSNHAALFLFMIAMPVFTTLFQPIGSRLSRKHEFEADDYAAQQSDAARLIQALVKLYRENASTLTPDPLYSAFHDSHPPAPVRIARLSAKLGAAQN